MIKSAFTEKYPCILNRLIGAADVESNDFDGGNRFIRVSVQWDTGASQTCISKELIQRMNLKPVGVGNVTTTIGERQTKAYIINLVINKEVKISDLLVIEADIGEQGIDILIGMDVISLGDFAVSNYEKQTYFFFQDSVTRTHRIREVIIEEHRGCRITNKFS